MSRPSEPSTPVPKKPSETATDLGVLPPWLRDEGAVKPRVAPQQSAADLLPEDDSPEDSEPKQSERNEIPAPPSRIVDPTRFLTVDDLPEWIHRLASAERRAVPGIEPPRRPAATEAAATTFLKPSPELPISPNPTGQRQDGDVPTPISQNGSDQNRSFFPEIALTLVILAAIATIVFLAIR